MKKSKQKRFIKLGKSFRIFESLQFKPKTACTPVKRLKLLNFKKAQNFKPQTGTKEALKKLLNLKKTFKP